MKIYLAIASVGGWPLSKIKEVKKEILCSYFYDKRNIKNEVKDK